jgi:hypothetical protein
VTFHLGDSLPAHVVAQLSAKTNLETATAELLDRGYGACWLKRPEIARLVEDALTIFDGERYRLVEALYREGSQHPAQAHRPVLAC